MGGETYQVYGYGFVVEDSGNYYEHIQNEDVEDLEEQGYTFIELNKLDEILEEVPDNYKEIIEKFKKDNPVERFYEVYTNMNGVQVYMVFSKYTHKPLDLEDFVKLKNDAQVELLSKMDNLANKFNLKAKWLVWFIDNE